MPDPQQKIHALVERFVHDVTAVVRESAIEALQRGMPERIAPSTVPAHRSAAGVRAPAARSHRALGTKRPPDEIDALAGRLREHISTHPGRRVEEINRALGTNTGDVMLPLSKLIAERAVKKTGQRRGTRYFPARAKARATKTLARAKTSSRAKSHRAKRRRSRR